MPLLLEWGEEIDLPCVCVAGTVFLTLSDPRKTFDLYCYNLTNEMSGIFVKS